MRKMMNRLNKREGFTLAELLIVVAIIAVLVAIAIPVFNSQLEKAREATDEANLRAAYAECTAAALTETASTGVTYDADTGAATKQVILTQKKEGWTTPPNIGGITTVPSKGTVTVTVYNDGTAPTIQ